MYFLFIFVIYQRTKMKNKNLCKLTMPQLGQNRTWDSSSKWISFLWNNFPTNQQRSTEFKQKHNVWSARMKRWNHLISVLVNSCSDQDTKHWFLSDDFYLHLYSNFLEYQSLGCFGKGFKSIWWQLFLPEPLWQWNLSKIRQT